MTKLAKNLQFTNYGHRPVGYACSRLGSEHLASQCGAARWKFQAVEHRLHRFVKRHNAQSARCDFRLSQILRCLRHAVPKDLAAGI